MRARGRAGGVLGGMGELLGVGGDHDHRGTCEGEEGASGGSAGGRGTPAGVPGADHRVGPCP
ncbi:hypothetical protein ASF50_06180 [Nocardioides sp. Leaf307]|nr:hypothetical protein ASF47_11155 [Nocardioides sp. Leaf285]KQQ43517.1 hypothetical protein ASF50_06180 [Nocardioides sp. Leaf307]